MPDRRTVPGSPRRVRTPAGPRRLRWQAYERFQQQLIASRIRPGQFVSQRELAALTGLPLGAIREVIPRLEAEGLLRTVPQRGLQIANVDVKLIRNAFQLRTMIEKEAAAQFALTVSDAELDALEARHRDVMRRAATSITSGLLNDAQAVDWGLHDAMVDALGNEILSALYRVNSLRIRLIRLDRVTLDADVLMPAMEEHMAIIAALRTRDPRLAIAALDAHLNHARNRALGLSRTS
jgi:DNA-binding GntR family transcriptional regulator